MCPERPLASGHVLEVRRLGVSRAACPQQIWKPERAFHYFALFWFVSLGGMPPHTNLASLSQSPRLLILAPNPFGFADITFALMPDAILPELLSLQNEPPPALLLGSRSDTG